MLTGSFDDNEYTLEQYVNDLANIGLYSGYSEALAIFWEPKRAAIMKGKLEQSMIIDDGVISREGKPVNRPPKPKPVLNIVGDEHAYPNLDDLQILKKASITIFHKPYAPLKYFLGSKSNEIDFENEKEFKNELRELEEIYEYLVQKNLINITVKNLDLNQIMTRPHYKYCVFLLLRNFKEKFF